MIFFNLLSYTLVMSITPGPPNNVICLALGSKYGYKTAAKYILGVVIGCFIMQWIMMMLHQMIASSLPSISKPISYVGAIYMIYLAYTLIRSDMKQSKKTNSHIKKVLSTKEGILLQFVNPKAYLFNLTIVSSYLVTMNLTL